MRKNHIEFSSFVIMSQKAFIGFISGLLVASLSACYLLAVGIQPVGATSYFISPTGNDSNTGTQTSPWKTFRFAIFHLAPGDTLILLDGTYDNSNSGFPIFKNINGTSEKPITIKAMNERQAHIHNDGTTVSVSGTNCSYLVVEGIQASSIDNPDSRPGTGGAFDFRNCHHLTFKRLLLHHNNRYNNSHLFTLVRVTDSLVEESEFYYFHRHAVMTKPGSRNTFRRLYCHSRGYGNIRGSYQNAHGPHGGDVCVSLYPGDNTIVENSIADVTTLSVFDIQASGPTPADNNRFLGNISLNTEYGAVIKARPEPGPTALGMPKNNTVTNFVAIGVEKVGIYFRGVRNQRCDHCMLLNNPIAGLLVDIEAVAPGDGSYSFFSDNSLSLSNGGPGFRIAQEIQTWSIVHANSLRNRVNYVPSSGKNYDVAKSVDPAIGTCRVWIPDSSPMKGAGANGKDIGANILYRYQDGILTDVPLWNPSTGEFPHGASVTGLNDVAGQSLFDVHKRLNVNRDGCSFPVGYGRGDSGDKSPARPIGLRAS